MTTTTATSPDTEDARRQRAYRARWRRQRRRLPKWLRRAAHSRMASFWMSLLSFLDACVSPVLPEVLMVPLCLARPDRRWIYGTYCAIASVLGAALGYGIGYWAWESGLREIAFEYLFSPEAFADVSARFGESAFLWIVLAAFTPLPFKIFTVAAGACHAQVDLTTLVVASVVGRFPRFYLEVWAIHRFGPDVFEALAARKWLIWTIVAVSVLLLVVL